MSLFGAPDKICLFISLWIAKYFRKPFRGSRVSSLRKICLEKSDDRFLTSWFDMVLSKTVAFEDVLVISMILYCNEPPSKQFSTDGNKHIKIS